MARRPIFSPYNSVYSFSKTFTRRTGCIRGGFYPTFIEPKGNVSDMMTMQRIKMVVVMMVRRSRFFSRIPVPALELYMDAAIMSEIPVPLPECASTKKIVKIPEIQSSTSKIVFSAPTKSSFRLRGFTACVSVLESNFLTDKTSVIE